MTEDSERDLFALPKTDLHVHLEGSIRVGTLAEIADANGVSPPPGIVDGRWSFADFDDFLRQWLLSQACLARPEDFARIAEELMADEAAQGTRYVEVHFSLPEHGMRLGDWEGPLEAVLDGLGSGERRHGVRWGLIVDVVRGIGLEPSRRAAGRAIRYAGSGVVAIGLGGSEAFDPRGYEDVFEPARAAGLHSVPHAGETGGPASIRGAIEALGAERLGHGIRVLEDPALVAEVREWGIALEVCTTSNVATGVVRDMAGHPLPRLLREGLTVTLSSDDPAMFDSPLAGEYEIARRVFGLSDEMLAGIARAGVLASFAPDQVRRELLAGIDAWLALPD